MSLLAVAPVRTAAGFGELVARQLAGIDAFVADRRLALATGAAPGASREDRMDLDRRLDVLEREHDSLLGRLDEGLRAAGGVLRPGRPTARVAHRHDWFVRTVSALLAERGVDVVGATVLGAEAVGWAVAEQPDLVVVDDTLAMLSGQQVVREVRRYCPSAVIAGHVAGSSRVEPMLEAGASRVHVRTVPPVEVVDDLVGLLLG